MEKQAVAKYIRISPYKAREITRLIQNKSVIDAMALVKFTPRKAGHLVGKVLHSAVKNAVNDPESNNITEGELFVKQAIVGEGPTLKRFRPKARGVAGRIRKRTSHIKITVSTYN